MSDFYNPVSHRWIHKLNIKIDKLTSLSHVLYCPREALRVQRRRFDNKLVKIREKSEELDIFIDLERMHKLKVLSEISSFSPKNIFTQCKEMVDANNPYLESGSICLLNSPSDALYLVFK